MKTEEKTEVLRRLNEAVTSPLTIGGLETSFNLADMYTHFENRDEVLSVLQARFPHALHELPRLDAQSWFEKVASLHRPQSYVSAYAGEVGEQKAIAALNALGIKAEQFPSLTHHANDLVDSHGVEYSVKSYDPHGAGSFLSVVRHTPESDHYVVNEELYAHLEHSGKLAELHGDGIDVINGHFSHVAESGRAADVLERIGTHQDVSDSVLNDVPIVACIVGIASAGIVGRKYLTGKASKHEVAMDLLGTCARFAAGSGGAAGGGAIGAAVGTAVLPILGTIVGGTIGGLLGSLGAREIVRDAVARSKWGTALDAFATLGARYQNGLPTECTNAIASEVFHRPEITRFVSEERQREQRFHQELDISDPTPPSPAAVLWNSSLSRAEAAVPKLDEAARRTSDALIDACVKEGVARFPRQRESARTAARSLYGSFLVEVSYLRSALPGSDKATIAGVLDELRANPNHPYRIEPVKADLLAALALRTLIKGESTS